MTSLLGEERKGGINKLLAVSSHGTKGEWKYLLPILPDLPHSFLTDMDENTRPNFPGPTLSCISDISHSLPI